MNARKQGTPLADKFGRKFEKWSVDELRNCIINYRRFAKCNRHQTYLGVSLTFVNVAMMIEELLAIRLDPSGSLTQVIDPVLGRAIKNFSGDVSAKKAEKEASK